LLIIAGTYRDVLERSEEDRWRITTRSTTRGATATPQSPAEAESRAIILAPLARRIDLLGDPAP